MAIHSLAPLSYRVGGPLCTPLPLLCYAFDLQYAFIYTCDITKKKFMLKSNNYNSNKEQILIN